MIYHAPHVELAIENTKLRHKVASLETEIARERHARQGIENALARHALLTPPVYYIQAPSTQLTIPAGAKVTIET